MRDFYLLKAVVDDYTYIVIAIRTSVLITQEFHTTFNLSVFEEELNREWGFELTKSKSDVGELLEKTLRVEGALVGGDYRFNYVLETDEDSIERATKWARTVFQPYIDYLNEDVDRGEYGADHMHIIEL